MELLTEVVFVLAPVFIQIRSGYLCPR